jgi:peptide-methionine (R)-S-oxide reductase
VKGDKALRDRLGRQAYHVTQEAGTEPAFTGEYVDHHEDGMYRCVVCGADLFASDDKFDSGSGWPSYVAPAGVAAVETRTDRSHGMERTEVVCRKCGSHLGHVFDDGPRDKGGLRYCINSCALGFANRP